MWPRDEPLGWLRGRIDGFYRMYISLVLSFVYFPDCDDAEDQDLNPATLHTRERSTL